jgi:hypothetical protein
MPITQMEAYLRVAERLPVDDASVLRRLERADRDILSGYGYDITPCPCGSTDASRQYYVTKLSTAPMGTGEGDTIYIVSRDACTCPDVPTARAGLCKHRLAIMIDEEMHRV